MDISNILKTVKTGTQTSAITGEMGDMVSVAGFSVWIQSITGQVPQIQRLPNNRAKVTLNEAQTKKLKKWFDKQIINSVFGTKENVEYDLKNVFLPLSLKYIIPIAVLIFLIGRKI